MGEDNHRSKPQRHKDARGSSNGHRHGLGEGNSQGIVRDQRGQEQPADKERAQQVTRTDQVKGRGQ